MGPSDLVPLLWLQHIHQLAVLCLDQDLLYHSKCCKHCFTLQIFFSFCFCLFLFLLLLSKGFVFIIMSIKNHFWDLEIILWSGPLFSRQPQSKPEVKLCVLVFLFSLHLILVSKATFCHCEVSLKGWGFLTFTLAGRPGQLKCFSSFIWSSCSWIIHPLFTSICYRPSLKVCNAWIFSGDFLLGVLTVSPYGIAPYFLSFSSLFSCHYSSFCWLLMSQVFFQA